MIHEIFDDKMLKLTADAEKMMHEKMNLAKKLVWDLPEGDQKAKLNKLLKSARCGKATTESMLKDLKNIVDAG